MVFTTSGRSVWHFATIIVSSAKSRAVQYKLERSMSGTSFGFHYYHSVFGSDGSVQSVAVSRTWPQRLGANSNGLAWWFYWSSR
jgi:pectin methylesterase-like acyl-CoA thioesterase